LIGVAGVILLGQQAARLTWLMYPHEPPVRDPASLSEGLSSGGSDEATDLSLEALVAARLFGQPSPADPSPEKPTTQKRLDAELGGIYHSSEREQSIALISVDGGDTELYREGDALDSDVRIRRIHADRVVLQRQGRRERLTLAGEKDGKAGVARVTPDSDPESVGERMRSRPNHVPTTSLIDTSERRRPAPGPRPVAREMP
jgi:general secretion pathway protein C